MKPEVLPNFPRDLQQESLKLINNLLELKSSAFYLVGPNMRHRGLVTHNLAKEDDKLYQSRYMHMDPLNPGLHEEGGETVIHMDWIMSPRLIEQLAYYQDFLKPMIYRYVADMFFRSGGNIIAVITMLRSPDQGAFSEGELDVLELVLSGAGNKAIANELMLDLLTVKSHLQHVFRKTSVVTRTELVTRIVGDLKVLH
jgi:DNA-binding CsgD family transcriptional regulator